MVRITRISCFFWFQKDKFLAQMRYSLKGVTYIIGASLSEPHIVVLSGCPSGGCLFAFRLAYDRISKWKIEILRLARVLHDSSELSLLRFTPVLQTT